jgi:hypothetical protein
VKAVVTIKTLDAASERQLKAWLANAHGTETAVTDALRDEIKSWLEADSGAVLIVDVTVTENLHGPE